jgi:hypothetical protein
MAGELKTIASLDNSRFLSGLSGMSSGLGGLLGKVAALSAGFLGIRAIANGFSEALDQGAQLNDLSVKTGVAAKDLFVLQQAFSQLGSSADSVGPAIQKMQQILSGVSRSGKRGGAILKEIGLDPNELKKLGTQDQFSAIAAAIGTIRDPAQQTAAAIELFGDAGVNLKALFANPDAIKQTAAALGQLPDQIGKNAARFDDLGDRMDLLKVRSQGIFVGAMSGLAPALSQLVGMIEKIDFSRIGKAMGDAIGIAVELFASGDITQAAGLAVSIGFSKAVNILASTVGSMTWWKGAAEFAIGAFMKLGAALIRIFTEPLSILEAGITALFEGIWGNIATLHPLIAKALGIENFKERSFGEILKDTRENGLFSISKADSADAAAKPFIAEGMRLMREAVANPKNVLDASEWQRQLSAILDKARAASEARAAATEPAPSAPNTGNTVITMPDTGAKSKGLEFATDAYAKIGGYLGGSGGSGIDFNRRTATATEQSVTLLKKIALNLKPQVAPAAVWG